MNNSVRFQSAVSSVRPRGARVIEIFSPKLCRRLQCFGEAAFLQWICLEADPTVQTFCERPVYFENPDGPRLADFWIRQQDGEMLLVLDSEIKATSAMVGDIDMPVRTILPAELAASRIWTGNWERILPVIVSSRAQIPIALEHALLRFVSAPMTLSCIEQEFVTGDPSLLRAAVFGLLHQGQLEAPQLWTESLSFLTCFAPGRAGR